MANDKLQNAQLMGIIFNHTDAMVDEIIAKANVPPNKAKAAADAREQLLDECYKIIKDKLIGK